MFKQRIPCLLLFLYLLSAPSSANEDELTALKQQLKILQERIEKFEAAQASQQNTQQPIDQSIEQAAPKNVENSEKVQSEPSITIGGAVRTNYSYTSYNDGSKNRGGDFDFDIFRFNFSGQIGSLNLDAKIRFLTT